MRRIIGLAFIVLLTILASLAVDFRDTLWAAYRNYDSPYLADLPGGAPRQALASRTTLVIVRGLRLDGSRQMATLNVLRARGLDATMTLDAPTYRLPRWLTLLSGASAAAHGVTSNDPSRADRVDTVLRQMQRAGQPTAVVGSQAFLDALGAPAARFEQIDLLDMSAQDDAVLAATLEVLRDPATRAQLVVIEFSLPEQAARLGTDAYVAAIAATDRRVAALMEQLDLGAEALVIAADRGLTDQAGDGGDEPEVSRAPLVMAGAGVQAASQAIVAPADLAPTLAALTGAAMPVHSQGQLIVAGLALPDALPFGAAPPEGESPPTAAGDLLWAAAAQLTAFYERWSEVVSQPRFAAESLRQVEKRLKAGDPRAYQTLAISLSAQAQSMKAARLTADRAQRLPMALGGALLGIAALGVLIGARLWQPLVGAAVYLAAWHVLYTVLLGYRYSLSMFPDGDPGPFLEAVARSATILFLTLSVMAAVLARWQDDPLEAVTIVMSTLAVAALVHVAQALWFYWQWDIVYASSLPDGLALVSAMVGLTQIGALSAPLAPGWPNLPVPLAAAVLTFILYGLARQRARRARRWR
jgi:hypothetical protein